MKEKTIYALGFFDGVHLGHQALLTACRTLAEQNNCRAGVVTFTGHPDTLVSGNTPALINTPEDRKALLLGFGMDTVVELPFTRELMAMEWRDFIRLLRGTYGAVGFVCGDDFRFGYRGEGNATILANYCHAAGMPYAMVPEQTLGTTRISSSHIRDLLEAGRLEEANRFLGHAHTLSGTVIGGRQLGRTIGIPTANLALPEGVICPRFGVYACTAQAEGKTYLAVTNIGTRPTVGGHHVTVEPWLLDFDGDLYGKIVSLQFHAFLRPEQKFDSLEALQAEIRKNAAETRQLLEGKL